MYNFSLIQRSKKLLVGFLLSESTIRLIGKQISSDIVTFLRRFIFPHEDYFAFHHYKNIRCFDEFSNTPLEGTNNGLKHCTFAVKGNMTIQRSSQLMLQQDSDKERASDMDLNSDLSKSRLCDLNGRSVSYISKGAAGQLMQQVQKLQNYASIRTERTTWSVLLSTGQRNGIEGKKIIPVFERMRLVTWNSDKSLSCDCGYMDRWGIPCRHMAHVAQFYSARKCCFSHHDVDIRWWDMYTKILVAMDKEDLSNEEINLHQKFKLIQESQRYPVVNDMHEFNGVTFNYGENSSEQFTSIQIDTARELFGNTKKWTILNYPCAENEMLLEDELAGETLCSVGITETMYLGDVNVENESAMNEDVDEGDFDITFCANVQEQVEAELAELQTRSSCKGMDAHDQYMPLCKEFISMSNGDSDEGRIRTESVLRSLISEIKERRATANVNKNVKGRLVTCTLGNAKEKFTRFQHKKQKFY